MEIVGIEINGVRFLPYYGKDNSTGYYQAFMHYCINNYFDRIIMTESLNKKFSLIPNDPIFKEAITYKKIRGYNGMYYSTYSGNAGKLSIIKDIANKLRIEVFVHTIE